MLRDVLPQEMVSRTGKLGWHRGVQAHKRDNESGEMLVGWVGYALVCLEFCVLFDGCVAAKGLCEVELF